MKRGLPGAICFSVTITVTQLCHRHDHIPIIVNITFQKKIISNKLLKYGKSHALQGRIQCRRQHQPVLI